MSLGKAVCLHSLNPIKTSSRISSHIPHISVYCSWAFIPQDRRLGFILQHTWDWQTNKQTGLWATRGDGGHGAGGPLPVSLSRRATNAGRAESSGQKDGLADWTNSPQRWQFMIRLFETWPCWHIHPSIRLLYPLPPAGGLLEPIPSVMRRSQGDTLD